MKLDTEKLRVREGDDADLDKRPTRLDPLCSSKEEYRSELDRSVAKLRG